MKNIYICVIGLIALGCSGGATTTRQIKNNSDQDIVLQIYRSGNTYGDSIKVASHSTEKISVKSYNQTQDNEEDCASGIDSAYTRTSNGGKISKNITLHSNWEVETEKTKIAPAEYEHTCTFTIYNSDIVE